MSTTIIKTLAHLGFEYQSTDGEWVIYAMQGSNYNEVIVCAINAQDGHITIDRSIPDSDIPQLWINLNQHDPVVEVILTHLTR